MRYKDFLTSKQLVSPANGIQINRDDLHSMLFDFQKDLSTWALKKGRAAIFATTGLGKTFMQLEYARLAARRTLILAPLAVAKQTVREASKLSIEVVYSREQSGVALSGITITNYEHLHKFNPAEFGAVVLDESSILKSLDGKTRTALIRMFQSTPMRLCCTATPAPNDIAEIANHAEFLGLMTRAEMLACFFVHDDKGWRLKGHAKEPFYRWLASWGMTVNKPSDLGYEDNGFALPPLTIKPTFVQSTYRPEGQLFATKLKGITERSSARKQTMKDRIAKAVKIIKAEPDESWLIWCGMNDESKLLAGLLPDAVEVKGSDSVQHKEDSLLGFAEGRIKQLITKPSIAGFGLNLQACARMIFVGLGDSYEQYFQSIRRCWRFGQSRPVTAHIVLSDAEHVIYDNVMRKEREFETMSKKLIENVAEYERDEIAPGTKSKFKYEKKDASGEGWHLMLGDSAERLKEIGESTIDLSVFSPPFGSLYTYSNTERDLGNSKTPAEFWQHFSFISKELLRVTKPGRNVCVHVAQIPLQKGKDGVIGLSDFRGETVRHFVDTGFIYHGEACIDKDPQAQAIRTKSKALLFVQVHKDSVWSRPALADYIIILRKPGENEVQIHPDINNEEWIEWARPIWYGIKESDTLQIAEARNKDDERHICPLQLGTIERCVRLWSNKGETVLSPFAGIGSEGYQSVLLERNFIGCELKPEYFKVAVKNLRQAEIDSKADTLWSVAEVKETAI